jgi:hypothetical protein
LGVALGITHIINCSEVANAHPQQFEYLQIASLKDVKLMVRFLFFFLLYLLLLGIFWI